MAKSRIGGSFAPPLTAQNLKTYRELANTAPDPRVRDAMLPLCEMVEAFQKTPESRRSGHPHPSGAGTIIPLEDAEIKRIWDLVPWDYECNALGELFETIPANTEKPLRNAAFHLLWYARELTLDREPLTTDKL